MEITNEELKEGEEWFGINLTRKQIEAIANPENAHSRTKGALKKKGLAEPGPNGLRMTHFGTEVAGFFESGE